jgi:hypothetical protein
MENTQELLNNNNKIQHTTKQLHRFPQETKVRQQQNKAKKR